MRLHGATPHHTTPHQARCRHDTPVSTSDSVRVPPSTSCVGGLHGRTHDDGGLSRPRRACCAVRTPRSHRSLLRLGSKYAPRQHKKALLPPIGFRHAPGRSSHSRRPCGSVSVRCLAALSSRPRRAAGPDGAAGGEGATVTPLPRLKPGIKSVFAAGPALFEVPQHRRPVSQGMHLGRAGRIHTAGDECLDLDEQ